MLTISSAARGRAWEISGSSAHLCRHEVRTLAMAGRKRASVLATHADARPNGAARLVDQSTMPMRLSHREEDERAAARFWVVGRSTRTRFVEPVGGSEQWHGPFDSYADAKPNGPRAWSTVDDAHARSASRNASAIPARDVGRPQVVASPINCWDLDAVMRPSRRPLRGRLRMRTFLSAINHRPHPEERPKACLEGRTMVLQNV